MFDYVKFSLSSWQQLIEMWQISPFILKKKKKNVR